MFKFSRSAFAAFFTAFVATGANLLAAHPTYAAPAPAGDPVQGEVVFAKCGICHSIKPGEVRLGPSLYGVVGRKSGSLPGFNYSDAMKATNWIWTPAKLDAYLAAPKAVVPGNKMYFVGLPNPTDRANVIAYLAKAGQAK